MSDQAFRRSLRVRSAAEFDRIYKSRVFAADDVLIVNGAANGLPHPRLGLSVSRKVGNAVVRNRWKRLIREAFRLSQGDLPPGIDLIARPQKGAEPVYAAIAESLVAVARRIARRIGRGERGASPSGNQRQPG